MSKTNNKDKSVWFKRKTWGWGWTPIDAKGWWVISVYIVLMAVYPVYTDLTESYFSVSRFGLLAILLTVALIAVCWLKGEKPKWTWGE